MTDTRDPIVEALEKLEASGLQFRYDMRNQFIKDIKRELQQVNGSYRNSSGIKVDLESYMMARLESSVYLRSKPSVKAYVSTFKRRTDGIRTEHKKFSETFLRKALQLEGYVFIPGVEEKAIEILSKNFLPEDDQDKGLTFRMISDTIIGALPSNEKFTLSELLNQTGLTKYLDDPATKIARLQHKAALRQTAAGMVAAGAKPSEVEKLVTELEAFEKRSLQTNKTVPYLSMAHITDEFTKRYSLDDSDRTMVANKTRTSIKALDDLSPIRSDVNKITVNNGPTQYTELNS